MKATSKMGCPRNVTVYSLCLETCRGLEKTNIFGKFEVSSISGFEGLASQNRILFKTYRKHREMYWVSANKYFSDSLRYWDTSLNTI